MKPVAIVIPFYKNKLEPLEEISVRQCFNILSSHDIIAVKPQQLELNYNFTFDATVSFDPHFFANITGYNKLMLSPLFYEKFLDYQYILIYQPDAYVFKDELLEWCEMGYDYIGAPWLRGTPYPDFVKAIKSKFLNYIHIKKNLKQSNSSVPTDIQLENRVGNGGFSLRNVKKFHEICLSQRQMIQVYESEKHHYFNEDVFWSLEVNRKRRILRIPDYKKAVFFAMETQLAHAFQITNGKLPFGCHAWDKHFSYWEPFICTK